MEVDITHLSATIALGSGSGGGAGARGGRGAKLSPDLQSARSE
jgi:hypothetical protein